MDRHGLAPAEIERRSLALVEAAIPTCSGWTSEVREIVKRMVYAGGDLALAGLARVHPEVVQAGLEALEAGVPVVCDTGMVAAGLRSVPNPVHVALARPAQTSDDTALKLTRAASGMHSLQRELDGGIAVIGNAPTALLALLDMMDAGFAQPALIIATPVGFVAAAESKAELIRRDVPYVTVDGTRGGSPLAAAAFNALVLLHDR